jgi:hypothetical protein
MKMRSFIVSAEQLRRVDEVEASLPRGFRNPFRLADVGKNQTQHDAAGDRHQRADSRAIDAALRSLPLGPAPTIEQVEAEEQTAQLKPVEHSLQSKPHAGFHRIKLGGDDR